MFKRLSITLLITTAVLFGGAIQSFANASSDAGDQTEQGQKSKVYFSINGKWKNGSWEEFNNYLKKCLSQYDNSKWNKKQENKNNVNNPVKEQPKKVEQPTKKEPKAEQPAQQQTQPAPTQNEQNEGQISELNQFEQQVIELTNNERAKQGLAPLKADTSLSKVAREKSRDMSVKNYFDHTSPTYGSPFDMMKAYGISYRTAGENIAKGQRTPAEVVNAWMNSPGHRANILNSNFTHIGVGYVEQGNHWTQMFIGK